MHFLKKGQKIRAWVDPPLIRAMPERKRFFSIDVFPNCWKESLTQATERVLFEGDTPQSMNLFCFFETGLREAPNIAKHVSLQMCQHYFLKSQMERLQEKFFCAHTKSSRSECSHSDSPPAQVLLYRPQNLAQRVRTEHTQYS